MVYFNPTKNDEETEFLEERTLIIAQAEPLYESAEGEFGGEATYHLNGKAYKLKDLPENLVKTLGLVLEDYLRIFKIIKEGHEENDNQR